MGDRIAVMKDGIIQQCDRPTAVYDHPANRFVGSFIGNPPMNFMQGQVQKRADGTVIVRIGEFDLNPSPANQAMLKARDGQTIFLGIRAENMEITKESDAVGVTDAIKARVLVVEPLGSQNLLTVKMGGDSIKVSTHPNFEVAPDEDVWLRFPADKIRWYEAEHGNAVKG